MCLAVPAKILKIEGVEAEVSAGGAQFRAGIQMIENAGIGDYVLIHAGFAIQKISAAEAEETLNLLQELSSLNM